MIKKIKKVKIPEINGKCLVVETYGHSDIANHMDLLIPEIFNDAKKNNLEKMTYKHNIYVDVIRKFCSQNNNFNHISTCLTNDTSIGNLPLLVDKSIDKIFIILVDKDQNSPNIWLKPIISKQGPDNNLYYIDKDKIELTLVEKKSSLNNTNNINIEGFNNIRDLDILSNVIRQKVLLEDSLNMDEMERLENYYYTHGLDFNSVLFRDDNSLYAKQVKSQKMLENLYSGETSELTTLFNKMIMEMSSSGDSKWVGIYEKFADEVVGMELSDFDRVDLINRNSLLYVNIQTFPKFAQSVNETVIKLTKYLVEATLLSDEFTSIRTLKLILEYNIDIIKKQENSQVDVSRMVTLLNESITMVDNKVEEVKKNLSNDVLLYNKNIVKDVEMQLESVLIDSLFDNTDALSHYTINQMMTLSNILETHQHNSIMLEGKVGDGIRKATTKAAQSSEKAANALRKTASDVKRNLGPINKIPEPFVKMFNNTVNKLKSMDSKERRERIITGNYKFKLLNYIKKTILFIASGKIIIAAAGGAGASLVGPLLWAIGAIASIAINKNLDRKERKKILFELESELDIVKEKIEDAKSDSNRNNKYELMRIQKKLEKDILRIKYHLKE